MAAFNKYNSASEALTENANCGTDTWRCILSNTAPDVTDVTQADAAELTTSGGYKLRKGYLIKGRRYFLSDDELAVHIAHMLQEVSRGDVKEITAGKPKVINRRTWDAIKPLERLNALSDMLATELIAEDDDEETLLMLM